MGQVVHSYERESIEKYFEARERLGLPIISVWTNMPMSRELKPNHELSAKIQAQVPPVGLVFSQMVINCIISGKVNPTGHLIK